MKKGTQESRSGVKLQSPKDKNVSVSKDSVMERGSEPFRQ